MDRRSNQNIIVAIVLVFIVGVEGFLVKKILNKQNVLLERQRVTLTEVRDLKKQLAAVQKDTKAFANFLAKVETQQPGRDQQAEADFDKVYTIDVGTSYLIGAKDAKVTVVEFVDFECPFSGRFYKPMVDAVSAYSGKVNYMIKNFPLPFHKNARSAAKAVMAAGEQGKYAEMATELLKDNSNFSAEKYKTIAKSLGLDMVKFEQDLKDKDAAYEQILNADMAFGQKVGVRGTPTFFINGKQTRARDVDNFKKEFDLLLKN
ncbi:MAG: thioredoxin domain-containing protein [Candidatus Omnitrophica bacterium]|nr:thioredoxin domain-containing protein [Candidatus Omnitrophota bacterium]